MTDWESPAQSVKPGRGIVAVLVLVGLVVGWVLGIAIDWPTTSAGQDASPKHLMCTALDGLSPSLMEQLSEPDELEVGLDHPDFWTLQAVPFLAEAAARAGSKPDDELVRVARELQRVAGAGDFAAIGTHVDVLHQYC